MSSERPKVFVVGCSGSGKTTLARQIASHFNVEYYELDFMAWDRDGYGSFLPYEDRVKMANGLAARDGWVVEGAYIGWTESLFEQADLIVWMDVPMRSALWRVFWRHVRAELRRDNRFPGWVRLFKFMKLVSDQYRNRFTMFDPPDIPIGPAAIRDALEQHRAKVLECSGAKSMPEVLARLELSQAATL